MPKVYNAQNLSATHNHHGHNSAQAIGVIGKHILVDILWQVCYHSLFEFFHHFQTITKFNSSLKIFKFGSSFHLFLQHFFNFIIISAQKSDNLFDFFGIFLFCHSSGAGCKTEPKRIIQTLTFCFWSGGDFLFAGANFKCHANGFDNFFWVDASNVWSKVALAIFLFDSAHNLQTRKIFFHVNLDVRKCLSIFEQDVVKRLVLVNEIAFKSQSIKFGHSNEIVKVIHIVDHGLHLARLWRITKILADTVFQIFGLANVNNLTFFVTHYIHTWFGGQCFEFLSDFFIHVNIIKNLFKKNNTKCAKRKSFVRKLRVRC